MAYIDGKEILFSGSVTGAADVVQEKGDSEEAVMSQKAVTLELNALSDALATLKNDFYYKAVEISTLSHGKGVQVMGAKVNSVTLSWKINKKPSTLTLTDATVEATAEGSKTIDYSASPLTSSKTWTLTATDERGATATKTATLSFGNYIYYGVAQIPSTYNSDFVKALAYKQLLTGYVSMINEDLVNSANGWLYAYYCSPVRLGARTFKYGGFAGGFEEPVTVSVTNSAGYTEDYYVYRSTNFAAITGTLTIS